MNDILPPKRPLSRPGGDMRPVAPVRPRQAAATGRPLAMQQPQPPTQTPPAVAVPAEPTPQDPPSSKPKKKTKKVILWILTAVVVCIAAAGITAYVWYSKSIQPVNAADKTKIRVDIAAGSTPDIIARSLEDKKLIRSQLAFDIYTRLSATRSRLQAGTYSLSPSESTAAIVAHLVSGKVDEFNLTFLPGATLAEDKKVLVAAGYKEGDVDAALAKTYDHPLFAEKPEGTDLEGYLYGETYTFGSSATLEEVLTTTFDHYYEVIKEDNLVDGFKKQGLTLFEGITLASIIQREVPTATDQKQVAQVFYKRLEAGMQLGSDVTYQYAAKKLGVAPTPELDSPYNTRKYTGLPPGPIATPGRSALDAVATPASGDYLYFLSGDDDKTYFSRTADEHEANIRDHCQVKCSIL